MGWCCGSTKPPRGSVGANGTSTDRNSYYVIQKSTIMLCTRRGRGAQHTRLSDLHSRVEWWGRPPTCNTNIQFIQLHPMVHFEKLPTPATAMPLLLSLSPVTGPKEELESVLWRKCQVQVLAAPAQ